MKAISIDLSGCDQVVVVLDRRLSIHAIEPYLDAFERLGGGWASAVQDWRTRPTGDRFQVLFCSARKYIDAAVVSGGRTPSRIEALSQAVARVLKETKPGRCRFFVLVADDVHERINTEIHEYYDEALRQITPAGRA